MTVSPYYGKGGHNYMYNVSRKTDSSTWNKSAWKYY